MSDVMRSTEGLQDGRDGVEEVSPPPGASVWRWLAGGLVAGLAWGVVARLWMRFVTDVPEFTWSGTLLILGVSVLAGLSLGAVELLRRRGVRVWRVACATPALVMFLSAGMVMAPSAVLGGFVVSGRGPRWLRAGATVLALAPLALFFTPGVSHRSVAHTAVALAWYLVLVGALAVAWSSVWRRRPVVQAGPA